MYMRGIARATPQRKVRRYIVVSVLYDLCKERKRYASEDLEGVYVRKGF